MTPLFADESLHGSIIGGLRKRLPNVNLLTAHECGLLGQDDPEILEWASQRNRLVVASDEQTMIGFAYDRIRIGLRMPGLIVVPQHMPIGVAIDDLELISECLLPGEWENQVQFLPL